MSETEWSYVWYRDRTVWLLVAAGAAGAVPAGILLPAVWRTAGLADRVGQGPVFLVIGVLPVCFFAFWALAWWIGAARRALRIGRLAREGVSVQASVEKWEAIRRRRAQVGVALWLKYEVDGLSYQIKKRTSMRGVAARRDYGSIELAVDRRSPEYVALVIDGRLG